jgi:hypothetical protein
MKVIRVAVALLIFSLIIAIIGLNDCEADWSVQYMPVSNHNGDPGLNEKHNGVGLTYSDGDFSVGGMRYKNSHNSMTTMIHVGKTVERIGDFTIGVKGAFVTGYEDHLAIPVVPLLHLSYTEYVHLIGIPGEVTALVFSFPLE